MYRAVRQAVGYEARKQNSGMKLWWNEHLCNKKKILDNEAKPVKFSAWIVGDLDVIG